MIKLIISICLCAPLILGNPIPRDDNDYLLPKNILPSKYTIELTLSEKDTFGGVVTIEADVKEDTQNIILHAAKDLTITKENVEVKVDGNTNVETITDIKPDEEREFKTIVLANKLTQNQKITIKITYEGKIRNDMYGLYKSDYQDQAGKTQYLYATQFEPTYARAMFPCFDQPNMKATFVIQVTVPEKYTHVLSNMMEDTPPTPPQANTKTYKFKETNKMSTYLVALVIATDDFIYKSKDATSSLKIWARKNAENQLKFAADNSQKFLDKMGEQMKLTYTEMKMEKMDMAAIPDFAAGAMENWGLLTYRESALLYDEKLSSIKDRQRVAAVIAHEQAHQWFGDLVTLNWWDNTWLNEGFATYFEYHTLALKDQDPLCGDVKVEDCWEMKKQFVIDEHQTALAADSVSTSSPLTKTVKKLAEIQAHFDAISYNKGGSIIRMMEHIVGTENFYEGLNKYLTNEDHQYKNTEPKNLFDSFDAQKIADRLPKDKTLEAIMTPWITQSGYPIVSVKLSEDKKKIIISQEKFVLDKVEKNDDLWNIPITYAVKKEDFNGDTKPKLWLLGKEDKDSIAYDEKQDFIVLNLDSTGYYRVNYELGLLQKISASLSKDIENIPDMNRALLVDDVLNLARISKLSYQEAFDNLQFLKNDPSYYTWSSAYSGYRFLLQRFTADSFEGKELRSTLLNMMKGKVYTGKVNELFTDQPKERVTATYNRVNALQWACDLEDEECLTEAKKIYDEKKDKLDELPVNTKGVIYCSALRKDSGLFEPILKKFKSSNVAAEKELLIKALGCNSNNITDLLELSVDGTTFRTQDTQYAFQAAYTGTPEGVDIVLDFVTEEKKKDEKDETEIPTYPNWDKMKQKYGGMNGIIKAITGLADRLTTKDQISKLIVFMENVSKSNDDIKNIKDTVIKTMTANLAWQDENKDALKNYFCIAYKDKTDKPASCKDDGGAANSITASCLAMTFGLFGAYLARF